MKWEVILSDSVRHGKIKELHLGKIPVLKTCDNWKEVEPIGWVDHEMRLTYYKGGLVMLGEKIFFVTERTINALAPYIKLKFPKRIEILAD